MHNKSLFGNYFSPLDRMFSRLHILIYKHLRWRAIFLSLLLVSAVFIFFSDDLKISSNYFILIPLFVSGMAYGLPGGLIAGILALPFNLLLFYIIGHPDYAPASLTIPEIFGISVGMIVGYLSDYFRKLNSEIKRREKTEKQLRELVAEKELLLKEINHRVRNNLGIISSIIQLQSNRVENPQFREEYRKLKLRIRSISLVHEQLYMENQPELLDIRNYLETLTGNLLDSYDETQIKFIFRKPVEPMILSSTRMLDLGLIVQEVIINSFKYAFPEHSEGTLSLDLNRKGDQYIIVIEDSGPGFSKNEIHPGLGTKLIQSLSSSLEGSYSWSSSNGCRFILTFPV
ncbi:MAG: histidine kinase dimerization/phosphoacceptor domain -containing protein [Spirochaetales bacterium]|nr:histidine kinase dimerization/phosphoacceptor domain -containing protein [Spirochaetales bacterium]